MRMLLVLGGLLLAAGVLAADYGDARAKMVAAYESRDYAAMRVAAREALDARPEYPGALFNLALAESLDLLEEPEAELS